MSKLIDITGKQFNDLTVVKRVENAKGGVAVWKCLCVCGNTTLVRGSNLKNGAVKSCGCRLKKNERARTHNMSKTRIYREWASVKNRCYNSHSKSYKDYGGRGITVCEEWRKSFEAFRDWAFANGYSDNLTIERIDTNGNYTPKNCKWIPRNEQQGNRRMCYSFDYKGESHNLADWCKILNLPYGTIHNRVYKLNWSFEKAICEPVHIEKRNKKYGRIC